jgi:hypothetical protein
MGSFCQSSLRRSLAGGPRSAIAAAALFRRRKLVAQQFYKGLVGLICVGQG